MKTSQPLLRKQEIQDKLSTFIAKYGESAIAEAIDIYIKMKQQYLCKSKTSISKLNICDINYLKIEGHHITICTQNGAYYKYGSLNQELKTLSPYGFHKCSQNCIVSISKIKCINQNEIVIYGIVLYTQKRSRNRDSAYLHD